MTDHNPYDFLSGDAPTDGAAAERSDSERSIYEEHAPDATIARADSVAALAASEAYEQNGSNGTAGYAEDFATVPELAPLAELSPVAEPQSAPESVLQTDTVEDHHDSEREILAPPLDPNARPEMEQDLFQHLGELRSRMLRAIVYVMVAVAATWNYVPNIQNLLLQPILTTLKKHGIPDTGITVTEPMQAFTTYFQLSLVAAIIVASPLVLWEMWRFIEPALTHTEKRYSSLLVPFSSVLFMLGCALGFATSPLFFNFFLAFVPPGVTVLWTYSSVVVLLGKMLLVFGVCFQVPVVVIFLNKTGIVQRNVLIEYWRHVVVVIFTIVAILTPTWDPFTLVICAVPPCVLYALSIWLIKWL